jgi:hypothetical protein
LAFFDTRPAGGYIAAEPHWGVSSVDRPLQAAAMELDRSIPPSPPRGAPSNSPKFLTTAAAHVLAFVMVSVDLMYVVPRFTRIFKDFDTTVPPVTVQLIDMSNWWKDFWFFPTFVLPFYLAALYFVVRANPTAARIWTYVAVILSVLVLAFTAVAVFLPMVTLYQKLNPG